MNKIFDTDNYGEIYLYQYANSCPGTGQYRGSLKGFPSHSKVEIRHSCCDCPPHGCGFWQYFMKGSGIWLDLGKTLIFEEHYQAFQFLLPDYVLINADQDLIELANVMRAQNYDTIQFLANNEYNIFVFEILDARYEDRQNSCPSTSKYYSQFASKPYTCECIHNECLNCKINNQKFQGQFPPCIKCNQYKFNTECLSSCPSGTIAKPAHFANQQYICLYQFCNEISCKQCSSSGNECAECYDEYIMKNGECVKKGAAILYFLKRLLLIWMLLLFILYK